MTAANLSSDSADWTFHKFIIKTLEDGVTIEFDVDIQCGEFRWVSNRVNANPKVAMPEIANYKNMNGSRKKQAFINMFIREQNTQNTQKSEK